MIINEDYFNDIEINDDDIKAEDNLGNFETLDNIYSNAKTLYNHTINIQLDSGCRYNKQIMNDILPQNLSKLGKYLDCLFDAYAINHSPLYAVYKKMSEGNEYKSSDFTFTQCNGYIQIANHKPHTETNPEHECIYNRALLYIFVEIPEFHDIKQLLKFIQRLVSTIWHGDFINYYDLFCLYNGVIDFFDEERNWNDFYMRTIYRGDFRNNMFAYNFNSWTGQKQYKTTKTAYSLIEWFFGHKTYIKLRKQIENSNYYTVFDYTPEPNDEPIYKQQPLNLIV